MMKWLMPNYGGHDDQDRRMPLRFGALSGDGRPKEGALLSLQDVSTLEWKCACVMGRFRARRIPLHEEVEEDRAPTLEPEVVLFELGELFVDAEFHQIDSGALVRSPGLATTIISSHRSD